MTNKNNEEMPKRSTGLRDKNGKEIYEGDILEYTLTYIEGHPKHKIEVTWGHWNCGCCNSVYGFNFGDMGENPEGYAEIVEGGTKDDK